MIENDLTSFRFSLTSPGPEGSDLEKVWFHRKYISYPTETRNKKMIDIEKVAMKLFLL